MSANARIGYARVSTDDQNLDLQRDALTKAGCNSIYEEKVSGKTASGERPEWALGSGMRTAGPRGRDHERDS